jgi:hypothetical protein
MTTIEYLKTSLEHAPQSPGQLASNLVGWSVPTTEGDTLIVCARCAGRILARGCHLPQNSEPIWRSSEIASVVCCLH